MSFIRTGAIALLSVFLFGACQATSLDGVPLPPKSDDGPIYLNEASGQTLIRESMYKQDFWGLVGTLETQNTQTLCSVASSVSVMNALPGDKPFDAVYYPYPRFTQNNFFTSSVSEVASMQHVLAQGMTLRQLVGAIRSHGMRATEHYAANVDLAELRSRFKSQLQAGGDYIIVNYDRNSVGQDGAGHFSPVAAYHESTDRVLIMDVARYKYRPAWVPLHALLEGMKKEDASVDKSRGWVEVRGPES